MSRETAYTLANVILYLHTLIVFTVWIIVLLGLVGFYKKHRKFGLFSAVYMGFYAAVEIYFWPNCPLTLLEQHFLDLYSPEQSYRGSCIVHWFLVVFHFNMPLQVIQGGLVVLLASMAWIAFSSLYRWWKAGIITSSFQKGKLRVISLKHIIIKK